MLQERVRSTFKTGTEGWGGVEGEWKRVSQEKDGERLKVRETEEQEARDKRRKREKEKGRGRAILTVG